MAIEYIHLALTQSKSQNTARLVLIALANYANQDGYSWPGVAKISELANCSERSAQTAIKSLKTLGEIEVFENQGARGTNKYRIILTPAESAPPQNLHPADLAGTPADISQTPAESAPNTSDTSGYVSSPLAPQGGSMDLEVLDSMSMRLGYLQPRWETEMIKPRHVETFRENADAFLALADDDLRLLRWFLAQAKKEGGPKVTAKRHLFIANFNSDLIRAEARWRKAGRPHLPKPAEWMAATEGSKKPAPLPAPSIDELREWIASDKSPYPVYYESRSIDHLTLLAETLECRKAWAAWNSEVKEAA